MMAWIVRSAATRYSIAYDDEPETHPWHRRLCRYHHHLEHGGLSPRPIVLLILLHYERPLHGGMEGTSVRVGAARKSRGRQRPLLIGTDGAAVERTVHRGNGVDGPIHV